MKNKIFIIAIVVASFFVSESITAQKFSKLDKSPMDVSAFPSSHRKSKKIVKVTYCRPFLKGRSIESLAPNDKVWRTGANEAVEIRFFQDVVIDGKEIEQGTYSLFTIPGDKQWTFILSSDVNVWGAYSYNKSNDVIRAKGKVSEGTSNLENFSITFEKDMTMCLGWGTTIVKLPIDLEEDDDDEKDND